MPMIKHSDGKNYAYAEKDGKLEIYEVIVQKQAVITADLASAIAKDIIKNRYQLKDLEQSL